MGGDLRGEQDRVVPVLCTNEGLDFSVGKMMVMDRSGR